MLKRAPASVEAIFDRYHRKVYGLAMAILMDRCHAEGATKDVFLAVVRKSDRLQENPALSTWIYRICVNACLMRMRGDQRTETVSIEDFLPVFSEEGAHASPVEDWNRGGDRRLARKGFGQAIGGFAAELPVKYRVVYALCDVRGFSYEDAARVLDLKIAVVKSRLQRTRLYLRERFSRHLRDVRGAQV